MPPAIIVDRRAALLETMVARLGEAERRAARSRRQFALAVPGGSVAEALFPKLAASAFDVRRTQLFWVDERGVPPEHSDSNYGRARALWIDRVPFAAERVHRLRGECADLERAAREAEEELLRTLGRPPRLDLAILGVGPDGHVASLFPGHPALAAPASVVAVDDAPKPPPRRLTLTLRTQGAARELWVVAFGAEKAAVVRQALGAAAQAPEASGGAGARDALPVVLAVRSGPPVTLFLDPEAAGAAPSTGSPGGF